MTCLIQEWAEGLLACRFKDTARLLQRHYTETFCNTWLEHDKEALCAQDPETLLRWGRMGQRYLSLLHPFMPFLTTELHERMKS